jgi:hypothetical protein
MNPEYQFIKISGMDFKCSAIIDIIFYTNLVKYTFQITFGYEPVPIHPYCPRDLLITKPKKQ